jgi:methyl-accepting chemotaxis protein
MNISRLLKNLSISQRTLSSVGLFALPLGVLFYFNLDQLSSDITFSSMEIDGNAYQRPLVRLVKAVGDYQVCVLASSSGQDCAPAAKQQEVDDLLVKMDKLESTVGETLGFSAAALKEAQLEALRVGQLRTKWQTLKDQSAQPRSKIWTDTGESLIADLRAAIMRAGDMSNLTLDPDMDSYYLMDVTSLVAAQSLARLRIAALYVMPLIHSQSGLPPSNRTQMAIFAATLKESDYDRIVGDLDIAFRENAKAKRGISSSLKPEVQPAKARYEQSLTTLLAQFNALADGKRISRADLQAAFDEAGAATVDLAAKTVNELDVVLQSRIHGYEVYRWTLVIGSFSSVLIASLLFWFVLRSITKPLTLTVSHLENVAKGDLSQELPPEFETRGDEIGQLSRSIGSMLTTLRSMIGEIRSGIGSLTVASSGLVEASESVKVGSRDASDKAQMVAAATEEMSSNVSSVAAGMALANQSLEAVSCATSQMTATISEIASNSEQARSITAGATQQAMHVTGQIQQLGQAAREIGRVTEVINEISSQTNLLALNATIEAARAGAAGKGFAVVANEIKTLAQQTAAATEDIRQRISTVQTATNQGIADVERVFAVVGEVNSIVTSIAAAIEEQATATKEIARSISSASEGVQEASNRVAESSQASNEIARDIVVVNRAAGEIAATGESLRTSIEEMTTVSEQLELAARRFRT